MTSKVKRFGDLERLAGSREMEASRRLASTLDALRAQQQQLEQLRNYMDEYREQQPDQGTDPVRWENYRLFLARLSAAIRQQETELQEAEARYSEEASRWQESHAHTQALSKLLEKYQLEDRKRVSDREQKDLDDRHGVFAPDTAGD